MSEAEETIPETPTIIQENEAIIVENTKKAPRIQRELQTICLKLSQHPLRREDDLLGVKTKPQGER